METFHIQQTTLDILLIEPPKPEGLEGLGQPMAPNVGQGFHSHESASRQISLGYKVALARASEKRLESIAFPGVEAQTCGCPLQEAARAAVEAARDYLNEHPKTSLRRILFMQYSRDAHEAFCEEVKNLSLG